jgi:hypothetical protein
MIVVILGFDFLFNYEGWFLMPTQHGTLFAQWVGASMTSNGGIHSYTLHPNNRNITAEAAIALLSTNGKTHWAETGISSIISNGVTENFDPPIQRIKRTNVTRITFRTASTSNNRVHARHIVNYWV